ncbi:hypothetical protein X896_6311 [Burkholderia pseudomallei ABCPW 1]|nr:hypothetical protein X896_6311 [Burkholderia pseudomallei ABCPW 1]CAJ8004818.1 Uncharacterised protein [Burkholderia pseudomallei]
MPIAICAPDAAPVANASGSTPTPNASEVITIGRSRSRAASSAASASDMRCATRSFATSTIRIAFFADKPIVAISPTLK